jgi:hypothetical protein
MTLHRLLPDYHAHLVRMLRDELLSVDSLSITTDSTFLTRHQVPYICITGVRHWIDKNWVLHDEVLAVFLAQQSVTAQYISTKLRHILENQLGVGRKVHCITTDEGKNFLAAVETLKSTDTVRESLRCVCHRLHLTMKKAFDGSECKQLKDILEKCSDIVNTFKNGWASTKRDVLFRYQQQYVEQLKTDVSNLQEQVAHGTRGVAESIQKQTDILREAERQLTEDKDERKRQEIDTDAVNNEVMDAVLNAAMEFDASQSYDDSKEEMEEKVNDVEVDEKQDEQTMADIDKLKYEAEYADAFVNYIFNKRALVQRSATRWLSYVYVVERCVIWHDAIQSAVMAIRTTALGKNQRDYDWAKLHVNDTELELLKHFILVGRACKELKSVALSAVRDGRSSLYEKTG